MWLFVDLLCSDSTCCTVAVTAGERLWLVGDGDALGNWDAGKASKINTH
jgi:hypothetical protein